MPRAQRFWLMKSEPEEYGIDHLIAEGRCLWSGVRNYQARNFMRDDMKLGDPVIFYHSNGKPTGAAGLARVVAEAHPDPTAFDPESPYYDPRGTPENPVWMLVDLEPVEKFPRIVTLAEMRSNPKLEGMMLLQRGSRLSVQPVTKAQFREIVRLSRTPVPK